MSRARQARKPGEGSRSSERIAIVEWAARLGAISAPALAERERSGVPSARAKLAAAERDGLLRRASPLRGAPALYTATRSGLRAAGLGSLGPCRVSASNAAHLAFCAAVAAALERRYPDHAVSSERELRRDERDARAPLASAHLSAPGAHGSLWHRPDLVLWPRAGEGLPTAVEVELTVKAPRRLEEICRAWARARCVAGAVYVAAPSVESALARAIARARAHERVVVVPLAAVVDGSSVPLAAVVDGSSVPLAAVVEGSSESPATLGDACAREPSQGARTLSGRGSTS